MNILKKMAKHSNGQCIVIIKLLFGITTIILLSCVTLSHGNTNNAIKKDSSNKIFFKDLILSRKNREIHQRSINEDMPILPHTCSIKPRNTMSKMVIYECMPMLVHAKATVVPELVHINGTNNGGILPTNSVENDTIPTRRPRHIYEIRDVTVQYDVPDDVTELRLWFQDIASVQDNAFNKLKTLKSLNLQHNMISYLAKEAFRDLPKLRELDLSYNRLQTIPDILFKDLKNLEVLKLHHNEITTVSNSMLCGLSGLLTLDISHNAVDDIGPYSFRHLRSSSFVSIELGYNKLTRPRKEWLLRGPVTQNDPLCDATSLSEKKILSKIFGKSLNQNKHNRMSKSIPIVSTTEKQKSPTPNPEEPHKNVVFTPMRFLRASHNPWQCNCDSDHQVIQFLRHYRSIMTSEFKGDDATDDAEDSRYSDNENDLADNSNKTENIKWYFTMPCGDSEFTGLDLGRVSQSEQDEIEKTCCKHYEHGRKFLKNDENLEQLCKLYGNETNSDNFDENHVTVIGILIVFCTPMLLTLCPDCNKKVSHSPTGKITTAGKFGGGSVANANDNNNNNGENHYSNLKHVVPKGTVIKEVPSRTGNQKFCLVVTTDETNPQTVLQKGQNV